MRDAVDLALATLSPGDLVALQLDGLGHSDQTARFDAAGIEVIEVPVYEWTLPDDTRPAVRLAEDVIAGTVHAVTFTAGPAIRNWMAIAAEHDLRPALRDALTDGRAVVGCVGPVCAEAATDEGLHSPHLVVPRTWRLGPLVHAVAERLAERSVSLSVNGASMTIAGNAVTVDRAPVVLTDTEAQVLAVLAAKPNIVHAKSDLLRRVWHDETADPHVVESVVNRLRRRLGPLGPSIVAVHRRGYTLRA